MPLIHAHVFNPAENQIFFKPKKSDPAEYRTVFCKQTEGCEVFKRGQCISRQFMGAGCPNGITSTIRGPTRMAKSFHTWVSEHKAKAKEIGYLEAPAIRISRVGDLIWLPYSFMDLALEGRRGSRSRFVPAAEFTPDLVSYLCSARPRSLFGDEIRDYQSKDVPLFIAHLSEGYADLLAEAAPLSARIREVMATLTKVGRKARLHTLKPNVGTFEGWTWDGAHMVSANRKNFPPFTGFNALEVRIVPGPNAEVKITDDGQVTPDTVFLD